MPSTPEGAGGSLIGEKTGQIPQNRKHEQQRNRRPPPGIAKRDEGPRRVQPKGEGDRRHEDASDASQAIECDRDPGECERERPAFECDGRVRPELERPGEPRASSAGGQHPELNQVHVHAGRNRRERVRADRPEIESVGGRAQNVREDKRDEKAEREDQNPPRQQEGMPETEAWGPLEENGSMAPLERERGERGRYRGDRPRDWNHRASEQKPAHDLVNREPPTQPKHDGSRQRPRARPSGEREPRPGGRINRGSPNDRRGHGEPGEKLRVDPKVQDTGVERHEKTEPQEKKARRDENEIAGPWGGPRGRIPRRGLARKELGAGGQQDKCGHVGEERPYAAPAATRDHGRPRTTPVAITPPFPTFRR